MGGSQSRNRRINSANIEERGENYTNNNTTIIPSSRSRSNSAGSAFSRETYIPATTSHVTSTTIGKKRTASPEPRASPKQISHTPLNRPKIQTIAPVSPIRESSGETFIVTGGSRKRKGRKNKNRNKSRRRKN